MKIQISVKRPRNQFVAACRQRKAGAHQLSNRKQQRDADLLGVS